MHASLHLKHTGKVTRKRESAAKQSEIIVNARVEAVKNTHGPLDDSSWNRYPRIARILRGRRRRKTGGDSSRDARSFHEVVHGRGVLVFL